MTAECAWWATGQQAGSSQACGAGQGRVVYVWRVYGVCVCMAVVWRMSCGHALAGVIRRPCSRGGDLWSGGGRLLGARRGEDATMGSTLPAT